MQNTKYNNIRSQNLKATSAGFTIIEVMIAMAIFVVLVTIGMGATLDAISQHNRTDHMRTVMDNLNFTLEDMARNIRLGSSIHCVTGTEAVFDATGAIIPQDCVGVPGVSGGSNKIVLNDLAGNHLTYVITRPDVLPASQANQIIKQKSDTAPAQIITPPEVTMDFYKSGFTVRGAKPFTSGDLGQPSVVIRLAGYVTYKNIKTKFAVQTTVTLRALDS